MALTKSTSYSHIPAPTSNDSQPQINSSTTSAVRRGQDFGRAQRTPSPDTYVKLRFQGDESMPETWFKMKVEEGVRVFTPSDRSPVVILYKEGDATMKMYHANCQSNFHADNPEGLLAEIKTIQRRDKTGFFLGGSYQEQGGEEKKLVGSIVGKESSLLLEDMSKASYRQWRAQKDAQAQAPQMVAGQELEFGF